MHLIARLCRVVPVVVLGGVLFAQSKPTLHEQGDRLTAAVPLGGPATVHDTTPRAFGFPARVLQAKERRAFAVGNAFFKENWVEAGASTAGRDGLGPLFNARSCSACHFKDGRGRPPLPGETAVTGFLLRLGVPRHEGPDLPHPVYGGQLQDRSVWGHGAEARIVIDYEAVKGEFADGEPYELQRPIYRLEDVAYGALGDSIVIGPRVAPQVIGLGLLEAIPDEVLVEHSDPDDDNGDGISGRVHWIETPAGERAIGRFGWKATRATVRSQSAGAFQGDIGITSSLFPTETATAAQSERFEVISGGSPELSDHKLGRVTFYTAVLAVPAQREPEHPEVVRGAKLFDSIGCAHCHVPVARTGDVAVIDAYRNVAFRPYTDLLLHDLGEGLADAKRDGDAQKTEWRTPPLWGLGLIDTVNGHTRLLHDGRARDFEEAVLWHGGEAESSRKRYTELDKADRAALLRFLRSL